MSVWADSLRRETAGRGGRPEQTSAIGARFAARKTNVCPFRSSAFQHQRTKYKFPAPARELRGFLPRQGHEYAEQMQEAATQMEQLRQDLVGSRGSASDGKAA